MTDSIQFLFDEHTIQPSTSTGIFQYLPDENSVAYLNQRARIYSTREQYVPYQRSMQFFDLSSGKMSSSFPLKWSGRERIINEIQNFYAASPDSIWVYPAKFGKDLGMDMPIALLNGKGEVEFRVPMRGDRMPVPTPYGLGGIAQRGNELIISSWIAWKENRMRSPFTNLKIRNAELGVIDYKPIPYQDFNIYLYPGKRREPSTSWSSYGDLAQVSSVINQKNELVSNFPLDHRLSIQSSSGKVRRKSLPSQYLSDFPILETKLKTNKELRIQAKASGRYIVVLYDQENELYYRVGRMPLDDLEPLNDFRFQPTYIYFVMVIDSNFNLIKEKEFRSAEYLFEKGLFAAKGGLFILKNDSLPDRMIFHKLELVKRD
ncbi:DUF4221 family protein [Roseivirga sp.]|uniref:DUF4221 family protein n=1 Tax=Roseivirga sp. TaxID=1964215 RepID=UPI003BAAB2EA